MNNKIKNIFILLFITFLTFITYKVISKINHKKEVETRIKIIPKFEYEKLNGSVFNNNNLKQNTPIIFVYFNSDCEFCNAETKMIKENINKFSDCQLVFISFENPNLIKEFSKKYKLDCYNNIHFVCDSKVSFATTFDVKSIPCLVLYNKDNQLIEKIKGQIRVETLIKKINTQ